MRAYPLTATLLSTALLSAVLSTAPAQAAPAQAASASAGGGRCSGTSCSFSFSPATTAAMKKAADRAGWLAGPTADIICLRIPNRLVRFACSAALLFPYNKAKKRLTEAYAEGGCFVVKAELGFTVPIRFTTASAGDPYCG
ncbi:hypothetical protein [Streptosporangium sp. OZ121]|uniref:hypothetical protein n=1 Tax=Streptosporangium sp. OZ121 TaxID=3444183 RepID=UPI003F78CFDC